MGREKWVMPEELKPYGEFVTNTGGNDIEDLMNDHDTTFFSNVIRAALICSVESQMGLLARLHEAGLLKEDVDGNR